MPTVLVLLIITFGFHLIYPYMLSRLSSYHKSKKPIPHPSFISGIESDNANRTNLPSISVIIPVYNEESVIKRRITNILDSDYPKEKTQIIIVDSGSTDKTLEIINANCGDRLEIIHETERNGKAHAINLALPRCTGEIVILTDGPTIYEKDTISE